MSQQRHQQQQQAPIIYDGDAFLPFRRKLRKLFDNIKYVPAPHVTCRWGACSCAHAWPTRLWLASRPCAQD